MSDSNKLASSKAHLGSLLFSLEWLVDTIMHTKLFCIAISLSLCLSLSCYLSFFLPFFLSFSVQRKGPRDSHEEDCHSRATKLMNVFYVRLLARVA